MNFKYVILLIFFSTLCFAQKVTIISYNILADECVTSDIYPGNEQIDWSIRFPRLCQKIEKSCPDIICLQEVTEASFAKFKEIFPNYIGALAKKNSTSGIGIATFCKKGLFNKVTFVPELCPGTSNCGNFAVQPILITRITSDSNKEFILINTKVKWSNNSDEHTPTINHFAHLVERAPQQHFMIVGDFNLCPESKHIIALKDCGVIDVFENDNSPTNCANNKIQRIDYIFASRDLLASPIPCSKISEGATLPNVEEPSDHIPLICHINL